MKQLFILFILLSYTLTAISQEKMQVEIKGRVLDKENGESLFNASVSMVDYNDSSVISSSYTTKNGLFSITASKPGIYQVCVRYLGYEPVTVPVEILKDQKYIDVGVINLEKSALNLSTVEIVVARPPMRIKTDTLEFNASSFKTRDNAVIEALLKKLPGVQVGRDGTIKVNGETVTKLMIDGKPFFANDLKAATRNLTADIVEKVQFIDGKTDWAKFTGINDGQIEKTINISLKKSRKYSYFGRVGADYGTRDHFAVNANLNRFSDDQQLAFQGNGNNISGYQDEGSQGRIPSGGNGDMHTWNGGINYSKDLGKQMKVAASYYLNDTRSNNLRNTARQNFLPDTSWFYNQQSQLRENRTSHSVNIQIDYKPDTSYIINFSSSFNYLSSYNTQDNVYQTLDGRQILVNKGSNYLTNAIQAPTLSSSIFLGKRFTKVGRTICARLSFGYNSNKSDGFNQSYNLFIQPGAGEKRDTIDQKNIANNLQRMYSVFLTYTEPVFKDRYLEFTYSYGWNNSASDKYTFNYDVVNHGYNRTNDSLSNSFKSASYLQYAGIRLFTQKIKYDYSIGMSMQVTDLDNMDLSKEASDQYRAINFFPGIDFNYRLLKNKLLNFSYAGSTQQPTPTQLQPVLNNNTPLYIQNGNPDLKPSFANIFTIRYTAFNPSTMFSMSSIVGAGFIINKIINASSQDSLGRQVSMPINKNGSNNVNALFSCSLPLQRLNTVLNSNSSIGLTRDVNLVNGTTGHINNLSVGQAFNFSYSWKELFDFGTSAGINYNSVKYSAQAGNNTRYLNYTFSFDGNINLPLGLSLGGTFDYIHNTGLAAGYNNNVMMLNAFISKGLFRNKKALIRIQGFDLLRQNMSIGRNVGDNFIEDTKNNVVQQFFMVNFSWFIKNTK